MAIGPFGEETWGNTAIYTCGDVMGSFHMGVWLLLQAIISASKKWLRFWARDHDILLGNNPQLPECPSLISFDFYSLSYILLASHFFSP